MPSAFATAVITRPASSTGARSTNTTPSGNAASDRLGPPRPRAGSCRCRPGPVMVTSRWPSSVSIRVTVASSSSRPTSRVSGDGGRTGSVEKTSAAGSPRGSRRPPAASNRSASSVARSAVTRSASSSASVNVDVRRVVVVADPLEQLVEPLLPVLAALEVDELRDVGREVPLVLEARHLLARGDPAVLLPVDADEDVALLEVGAVQLARRMRPRAELEHHRREGEPLDRGPRGAPLGRQLLQRRADEHAQALVGRPDATGDRVHASQSHGSRASRVQMQPAANCLGIERTGSATRVALWPRSNGGGRLEA